MKWHCAPNPRLQRTRATRSPLSRQPLGDHSELVQGGGCQVVRGVA
jgi:hypothetical protein